MEYSGSLNTVSFAGSYNVIVSAEGGASTILDRMSSVFAGRIFCISFVSAEELEFSVSAGCRRIGEREVVCSEVFNIKVPENHPESVLSFVLGKKLTGKGLSLVLPGGEMDRGLIGIFNQYVTQCFCDYKSLCDSQELEGNPLHELHECERFWNIGGTDGTAFDLEIVLKDALLRESQSLASLCSSCRKD